MCVQMDGWTLQLQSNPCGGTDSNVGNLLLSTPKVLHCSMSVI